MRLYIETSVWNMLIDEDPVNVAKRDATRELLNEAFAGKHELFVSDLVLQEVGADPSPTHRAQLEESITQSQAEILRENPQVLELGRAYAAQRIVPEKYLDDATHIAYAVYARLDVVVSWNLRHIVKVRTRREIREYNEKHGRHVPDVATPSEVIRS